MAVAAILEKTGANNSVYCYKCDRNRASQVVRFQSFGIGQNESLETLAEWYGEGLSDSIY